MKDYSEHFENPEAFLTDVELTNDSIIAKFPKGYKKTVEKNKENYQKFNERMEQQYLKLIDNAGKLLKKYNTSMFLMALFALFFNGVYFGVDTPVTMNMAIAIDCGLAVSFSSVCYVKSKKEKEISLWKDYLENKEELEHALEDDKDIVADVSKKTQKRLVKQQEYISEKLTENVFDTLVMDDIPLSDTKKMIEQLKIYKALLEPVKSVYEEEQQNDIKKKSRKK